MAGFGFVGRKEARCFMRFLIGLNSLTSEQVMITP